MLKTDHYIINQKPEDTLLKKMLIPVSAHVSPPPPGLGRVGLKIKKHGRNSKGLIKRLRHLSSSI